MTSLYSKLLAGFMLLVLPAVASAATYNVSIELSGDNINGVGPKATIWAVGATEPRAHTTVKVTADHKTNQWQTVNLTLKSASLNLIAIGFFNDLVVRKRGVPDQDRNLYIRSYTVNGVKFYPHEGTGIFGAGNKGYKVFPDKSVGMLSNGYWVLTPSLRTCNGKPSGSTYTKTLSTVQGSRSATVQECSYGGTVPTTITTTQSYTCSNGVEKTNGTPAVTTVDNGAPMCEAVKPCGANASGSTYTKTLSNTNGTRDAEVNECAYGGTVSTVTTVTQSFSCTNGVETAIGTPTSVTSTNGVANCKPALPCGTNASGSIYTKNVSTTYGTREATTTECANGGTVQTTTVTNQTYTCTNGVERVKGDPTTSTIDSPSATAICNALKPCGENVSGSTYSKELSQTDGTREATAAECSYGGTVATRIFVSQNYTCTNGVEKVNGNPSTVTLDNGAPACKAPQSCGVNPSGSTYLKQVSQENATRNATAAECPYGGKVATTTVTKQNYTCTNGVETATGSPTSVTADSGAPACNAAPKACGANASGTTYTKQTAQTFGSRIASVSECSYGGTVATTTTTTQSFSCLDGVETANGSPATTTVDGAKACNQDPGSSANQKFEIQIGNTKQSLLGVELVMPAATIVANTGWAPQMQGTSGMDVFNPNSASYPTMFGNGGNDVYLDEGGVNVNVKSGINTVVSDNSWGVYTAANGVDNVINKGGGPRSISGLEGNALDNVIVSLTDIGYMDGKGGNNILVGPKTGKGGPVTFISQNAGSHDVFINFEAGNTPTADRARLKYGSFASFDLLKRAMTEANGSVTLPLPDGGSVKFVNRKIADFIPGNFDPTSDTFALPLQNGACGAAYGKTNLLGTPSATSDLCSAGKPTLPTEAGGTFSWTCIGISGGTTASCTARMTTDPVNGQCGSSSGQKFAWNATPATQLCNLGKVSTMGGNSTTWQWTCEGLNGGTAANCSAEKLLPKDGQCGLYNGVMLSSAPMFNLCAVGAASTVTGTGPWNWTCGGLYDGATVNCQAQKGVNECLGAPMQPTGGVVYPPETPKPTEPGDITGIIFQNLSADHKLRYQTFGQLFKKGAVHSNDSLVARYDGKKHPVQMDAKAFWPDGSVRFAALTLGANVCVGSQLPIMIAKGTPDVSTGTTPVDLANASYTLNASLNFKSGSFTGLKNTDLKAALRQSLADPAKTDYWLRGPLATQARVEVRLAGSNMALMADVTAYKDGEVVADVQVLNDLTNIVPREVIDQQVGQYNWPARLPPEVFTPSVTLNDQTWSFTQMTQWHYQNWHVMLRSKGPREINVQHDPAYLIATGAFLPYDLKLGVTGSALSFFNDIYNSTSFGQPLSTNWVTTGMPSTGGRADIGFMTMFNTIWLMTQDYRAARVALGQGDASGSVPWNLRYHGDGRIITTHTVLPTWQFTHWAGTPYTRGGGKALEIWALDYRCSMCTEDLPTGGEQEWQPDIAHRPNLTYSPYVKTAQRWYLDLLNLNAAQAITSQWPAPRCYSETCDQVIDGNQVRGAAWAIREIMQAAFIGVKDSYEQVYFTEVLNNNMDYVLKFLNDHKERQGDAYGWLPNYCCTITSLAPWQQDFFTSVVAWGGMMGYEKAKAVVDYQRNWLRGRFDATIPGWNTNDGCAYNLNVARTVDGKTVFANSWKNIQEITLSTWGSNLNRPCNGGYYAQTARAALIAALKLFPDDAKLRSGLDLLMNSGAEYIDPVNNQKDPTWYLERPE